MEKKRNRQSTAKRYNQRWTKEEDDYLIRKWGLMSRVNIASNLDRSPEGVRMRAYHLGLLKANDNQDMLVKTNVCQILGYRTHSVNTVLTGAPFKKVVTGNKRKVNMIRHEDLMEWLRTHQDKFDASRIEEYALGVEPEWLREKRRVDIDARQKGLKRKRDRWSPAELDEAIRLHKRGWSDEQIAELHGRTPTAVYAALMRNGIWRDRKKTYKKRKSDR